MGRTLPLEIREKFRPLFAGIFGIPLTILSQPAADSQRSALLIREYERNLCAGLGFSRTTKNLPRGRFFFFPLTRRKVIFSMALLFGEAAQFLFSYLRIVYEVSLSLPIPIRDSIRVYPDRASRRNRNYCD